MKPKILIMDDEDDIREVIAKLLNYLGYKAVQTKDSYEAIYEYTKAIEIKEPYDVVVLDLTMAYGLNGIDTLKRLREMNPNIKGIICTGYSNVSDIEEKLKEAQIDHIIHKPFKINELEIVLSKVLGDKFES
ncbi:MAG: response regulator [Desulfobacterales bacterium]|nr:response regulator [Desulfobacterales bacterium]